MLCQFYRNVVPILQKSLFCLDDCQLIPIFASRNQNNNNFLNITTMAEDLKKQQEELQEEQLQDEQLQEVNGGRYSIVFIN